MPGVKDLKPYAQAHRLSRGRIPAPGNVGYVGTGCTRENAVRFRHANPGSFSSVTRWTAVLCLLLVGLVAAAQAVHYHPNEPANDAKHCKICQVAHASAQPGPVAQLFFSLAVATFVVHSDDADPKPVPDTFSLFSRPPPSLV